MRTRETTGLPMSRRSGWVYTGLLLGLAVGAVFSPGHTLLLDFNRFGELWADVGFFALAFGLMTWFLFFKQLRKRRTDRTDREESLVHRQSDGIAGELGDK